MSVYRIYVEKKPEFAVEANSLIGGIKSALGLENLTGLRVINRYDAEGLSREDFDLAAPVVFSEPAVDVTYDHLPAVKADEFVLQLSICQVSSIRELIPAHSVSHFSLEEKTYYQVSENLYRFWQTHRSRA